MTPSTHSMPSTKRRVLCKARISAASLFSLPLLALGLASLPFVETQAADGTWTQIVGGDASGTWSDADIGNWAGDVVADGSGFTADFSTLDITGSAGSTISLGEPRTIGNLIFGDTDNTTVSRWILDNGGSASNILTLEGSLANPTPTITVNDLGAGTLTNSTVTISAVITGSEGLTKDGNGTVSTGGNSFARGVLVLSGVNTYSGGTTISSGALAAANSSALGTGAVTVSSGAQLQVRGVNIANTININGANALHSTAGSGSNLSGIVNLQSDSGIRLATNSGNATMTLSGTLNLSGNTLTVNTINISTPAVTISGVINGSGGITKNSDGILRINGDNINVGTYSGTTTLNRGVVEVGSDGALGSGTFAFNPGNDAAATIRTQTSTARTIAAAVTIGGGNSASRYLFGSTNATFNGDLTFTNTTNIALSTGQKRFEVGNRTQFNAGFTGSGGITMQTTGSTGLGTLVLNGINTYTGNTTVNAGTLELASGAGMAFTIGAAGVNNQINGAATVSLDGEFTFNLSGAGTTIGDSWLIVDVNSLAATTFGNNFSVFGFTENANVWTGSANGADYQFSESTGMLTVIPEPATYAMLGIGMLAFALLRRRRAVRSL